MLATLQWNFFERHTCFTFERSTIRSCNVFPRWSQANIMEKFMYTTHNSRSAQTVPVFPFTNLNMKVYENKKQPACVYVLSVGMKEWASLISSTVASNHSQGENFGLTGHWVKERSSYGRSPWMVAASKSLFRNTIMRTSVCRYMRPDFELANLRWMR